MAATREHLEARIRQQLGRIAQQPRQAAHPLTSTALLNSVTESILAEVDEYASAELGLITPAERRHILLEATS